MGRVEKRPAARADLVEIWQYIADDSPQEADRFLDTLEEQMELISENPEMGTRREELAEGLRGFPTGNYVIFYRLLDRKEGIEVVRVLNAARDVTKAQFEWNNRR